MVRSRSRHAPAPAPAAAATCYRCAPRTAAAHRRIRVFVHPHERGVVVGVSALAVAIGRSIPSEVAPGTAAERAVDLTLALIKADDHIDRVTTPEADADDVA